MSDPERICTECNLGGIRKVASFVIYEADGLAKFACAEHHEKHTAIGLQSESTNAFFQRLLALDAANRLGMVEPPSESEMLTVLTEAALKGKTEAFLRGTVRRCQDCKRPVHGGPTRCTYCAKAMELDIKKRAIERAKAKAEEA